MVTVPKEVVERTDLGGGQEMNAHFDRSEDTLVYRQDVESVDPLTGEAVGGDVYLGSYTIRGGSGDFYLSVPRDVLRYGAFSDDDRVTIYWDASEQALLYRSAADDNPFER